MSKDTGINEKIQLVELSVRPTLAIKTTVGTMQLPKVMGPAYEKISKLLESNGNPLADDDVPFCIYHNLDWSRLDKKGFAAALQMMFFQKWDLEMGISCVAPVEGDGEVVHSELPAGRFLKTIHTGPYAKVGDTYNRIRAFATKEHVLLRSFSIERYFNDPRKTPRSELRTEVLVPING